jgi:diacylglycerol O-acyltransferase
LFALISRLHATLLDRNRPLWEIHLIEGLQNRQFALYMKMHHAAIDGMGSIQIYEGMCSTNKSERITCAPFSLEAQERYQRKTGCHQDVDASGQRFNEQPEPT